MFLAFIRRIEQLQQRTHAQLFSIRICNFRRSQWTCSCLTRTFIVPRCAPTYATYNLHIYMQMCMHSHVPPVFMIQYEMIRNRRSTVPRGPQQLHRVVVFMAPHGIVWPCRSSKHLGHGHPCLLRSAEFVPLAILPSLAEESALRVY